MWMIIYAAVLAKTWALKELSSTVPKMNRLSWTQPKPIATCTSRQGIANSLKSNHCRLRSKHREIFHLHQVKTMLNRSSLRCHAQWSPKNWAWKQFTYTKDKSRKYLGQAPIKVFTKTSKNELKLEVILKSSPKASDLIQHLHRHNNDLLGRLKG